MYSTPCSFCKFANKNDKSCLAGEHNIDHYGSLISPGFCRLYTEKDFYDINVSLDENINNAKKRSELKYDVIILFDNTIQKIEDVYTTIDYFLDREKVQKICVLDFKHNVELHCKPILERYAGKQVYYTGMVDKVKNIEKGIDFGIKLKIVTSPYVLVVEAGRVLIGIDDMVLANNRSVFWSFPIANNKTLMWYPDNPYGLYIKQAYLQLGGSHSDNDRFHKFLDKLQLIYANNGLQLTWFCERCYFE